MFRECTWPTSSDINVDLLIDQLKCKEITFDVISKLMSDEKLSGSDFARIAATIETPPNPFGYLSAEISRRSLEYQASRRNLTDAAENGSHISYPGGSPHC